MRASSEIQPVQPHQPGAVQEFIASAESQGSHLASFGSGLACEHSPAINSSHKEMSLEMSGPKLRQ